MTPKQAAEKFISNIPMPTERTRAACFFCGEFSEKEKNEK